MDCLHRFRAYVEVLLQPGIGRRQVGLKARVVPRKQCDTGGEQPQLQIFSQIILLRHRHQRRRGTVGDLDPDKLPGVIPESPQKAAPRRIVARFERLVRWTGRQTLIHRQRQRVNGDESLIDLQTHAHHVDKRYRFQPIDVACKRPPQRHELRPLEPLQLGIGQLQCGQSGRNVAGELQLLACDQQHLLDFGDRDFIARWRQVAVKRFQCRLVCLRLGLARLQQRDLCLRIAQVQRELSLRLAGGLCHRFHAGEPLRHFHP